MALAVTAVPAPLAAAVSAGCALARTVARTAASTVASTVPGTLPGTVARTSTCTLRRGDAGATLERRLVVVEGRHAVVVEGSLHVVGERPGREQPIVEGHVRRLERDGRNAGLLHARVPGDLDPGRARGDVETAGLQQLLEKGRMPPLRANDVRERAHVAVVLQDPAVHGLATELVLEGLLDPRPQAAAQRRGPLCPSGRRRGVARVGGRRLRRPLAAGASTSRPASAAGSVFVRVIFTECLPVATRASRRPGIAGQPSRATQGPAGRCAFDAARWDERLDQPVESARPSGRISRRNRPARRPSAAEPTGAGGACWKERLARAARGTPLAVTTGSGRHRPRVF